MRSLTNFGVLMLLYFYGMRIFLKMLISFLLFSVLRKQGKLILFLRSFILARPTKRGLKERGILRERVFSCDLGEHLLNSGSDGKFVYSIQICEIGVFSIAILLIDTINT